MDSNNVLIAFGLTLFAGLATGIGSATPSVRAISAKKINSLLKISPKLAGKHYDNL